MYYSGRSTSKVARFKRSRSLHFAVAAVLAPLIGISTAVAATADPTLTLYEVDGMVLASGKHFGSGQTVTVEATLKDLEGSGKTESNQLGSFKVAIEVDAKDGDRIEVKASAADDFRVATLVFGEGQLEPAANKPPVNDTADRDRNRDEVNQDDANRDEPVEEPSDEPAPPPAEEPAPAPGGDFASAVIDLTNRERANAGLGPLERDDCLTGTAQNWSDTMSRDNFFEHGDINPLMGQCNLNTVGENIAYGYDSPESVVQGWMDSPGHRENIMNGEFTKIGVGYAPNGAYATQQFGG